MFPLFPFDNSYARLPDRFYCADRAHAGARAAHGEGQPRPRRRARGSTRAALATPEGAELLAGNRVPEGAEPIALAYAGHQFGSFVPQLGDGRAILLGEVVGKDGLRRDIQLKGAGRTPYSRGGDGRAALGPVLREYVVSEAMAALGIPTTRALAAATTGEPVARDALLPGRRAHPRGGEPHPHRHLPVLRRARRPRGRSPRSPRTRSRATTRDAAGTGNDALALLERVDRRAGVPGRALARRRVRPRRHEHRQHDHLGRDDRLRAVRVPRRVRSGQEVQLHRQRWALRVREPAADHARGTSRGSPRRCCRSSRRPRSEAVRLARERLERFVPAFEAAHARRRFAPSWGSATGRTKPRPMPRSRPTCYDTPRWRRRGLHAVLPAPVRVRRGRRGRRRGGRRSSRTPWRSTSGPSAGERGSAARTSRRTPALAAMQARRTPPSSRVTIASRRSSRRPSRTATSARSRRCSTSLSRPYEDRPELARYADPPKNEERVIETFCGT